MVNSKHVSNKSKSTPTIALRTRKTSTQDNKRMPATSRTNDENSLVETTKNVIKEVNSEKRCISGIIRKVLKKELQYYEKNITELIQS